MSIISKISEILDERGITAAQMSRDLGFSSGLFSQWKRGKQEPRKKSVEAIRAAGRIASNRAWPLLHPRLPPGQAYLVRISASASRASGVVAGTSSPRS